MLKKLSRAWAPVAVALALALSACATDDPAAGGTTAVDDGGLKGDPIVIGSLCSCTGPLAASLGRSLDVLNAWASYTNTNGGINGHPVKVISYDDGQNAAQGLSMAKKLVEEDKVVAIVGQMSLVSDSWSEYVTKAGIPVVGGQPVDSGFFTNPNFFTSGSTLPLLLLGEVSVAAKAGAQKIGLFYCSETPICAQLPPIIEALAGPMNLAVEKQMISSSAPNYIAPCRAFKDAGVDAVFAAVNSDVVPRVSKSCSEQNFDPIQIASSATTQKSWTEDPIMDGSLVVGTNAAYTDESVPGVKNFLDAITEYVPDLQDSPQFSYPMIYPWAGGELFKAAAEAADLGPTSTPADVVTGLRALKDETLDGVSPPLNFPEGVPGFPLCYFTSTITGGAFEPDADAVCIDQETANGILAALAGG